MRILVASLLCDYVAGFVGLGLQCRNPSANVNILVKRPASVKSDGDQCDDKTIFYFHPEFPLLFLLSVAMLPLKNNFVSVQSRQHIHANIAF